MTEIFYRKFKIHEGDLLIYQSLFDPKISHNLGTIHLTRPHERRWGWGGGGFLKFIPYSIFADKGDGKSYNTGHYLRIS